MKFVKPEVFLIAETTINVPENLAVVGYDDGPSAEKSTPKITTIRIPWDDIYKLALDMLSDKYQSYYGGSRYSDGWYRRMAEYQDYLTGRRYLEMLAASVGRLLILHEKDAFILTRSFEGQTVLSLVNVMCQRGLHFAKPESGGESTYRKLFYAMREVFKNLRSPGSSSP